MGLVGHWPDLEKEVTLEPTVQIGKDSYSPIMHVSCDRVDLYTDFFEASERLKGKTGY